MKCPHCLTAFHSDAKGVDLGKDEDRYWRILYQLCPTCKRFIISLEGGVMGTTGGFFTQIWYLVRPKSTARPVPSEVPDPFAQDYREACLVLSDSPKASAALSRRCLQNILREHAGVNKSDLSHEIDEVLQSRQLPGYLAESIDAVRNVGNFAAHAVKSTNSGEIVEVELGEAEWLLDVLEGLFDFYFVQPAAIAKKRDALNQKLSEAGKPPMKKA